ncbi:hypothetical protein C817_00782, partial [Dorea sp. 5-2]
TPCVGVWIEMPNIGKYAKVYTVTPCVGVWIEIRLRTGGRQTAGVTPCVGVWIEIVIFGKIRKVITGHSLCGSVD